MAEFGLAFNRAERAAGQPGIPDAELGENIINATGSIAGAGGFVHQLQQAMQPGQQSVQEELQTVKEELQTVKEMLVGNFNLTSRFHNRNAGGHANSQLLPLRKERHPQPVAPGTAEGAGAFGALPPPGMFPPTWAALHGEWSHAQLDMLEAFYEEDFGQQNMLLSQRKNLFGAFITRV